MTATKLDPMTAHDRASELGMTPVVVGPLVAIALGAASPGLTVAAALGAACAVVAMGAFVALAAYGNKIISAADPEERATVTAPSMTRSAFAGVAGLALGLTAGGAALGMAARGVTHYVCQLLG